MLDQCLFREVLVLETWFSYTGIKNITKIGKKPEQ